MESPLSGHGSGLVSEPRSTPNRPETVISEKLPPNQMIEDNGDEPMSNHSTNPFFSSIIEKRISRRQVLAGGVGAAVAGLFSAAGVAYAKGPQFLPPAAQGRPPFGLNPTLGFAAIPVVRSDTATVPYGYKVRTLIPWGTPINGSSPAYDGVNGNSGAEQEQQVGSHHDGMHYFPWLTTPTATASCA